MSFFIKEVGVVFEKYCAVLQSAPKGEQQNCQLISSLLGIPHLMDDDPVIWTAGAGEVDTDDDLKLRILE